MRNRAWILSRVPRRDFSVAECHDESIPDDRQRVQRAAELAAQVELLVKQWQSVRSPIPSAGSEVRESFHKVRRDVDNLSSVLQ